MLSLIWVLEKIKFAIVIREIIFSASFTHADVVHVAWLIFDRSQKANLLFGNNFQLRTFYPLGHASVGTQLIKPIKLDQTGVPFGSEESSKGTGRFELELIESQVAESYAWKNQF